MKIDTHKEEKKVHVLVDNVDIGNANSANLRAALSAALLLLPSKFTEEDLYSKICSLSYMGDLRMLFAEDKNKDCGLSVTRSLLHALPPLVRSKMRAKLGEKKMLSDSGKVSLEVRIHSREEAARCLQRVVRHTVMVSSVRQAVSGLLAAGGINATRYLASKVCKAWRSWT